MIGIADTLSETVTYRLCPDKERWINLSLDPAKSYVFSGQKRPDKTDIFREGLPL